MDILRQIVAGPRQRHAEAGLDLCYVTEYLIATSGPSATYPQVAYRNPLRQLVKFLDSQHGANWAIWEFRAEGTGYPDAEVYGRIRHYPWPDHHPPPFALVPLIMASMRNWLKGEAPATENEGSSGQRVAVVHCKAGKGRSGTITCSYLISEEGWKAEDALDRFTQRRMRPGFGAGVSIPSQLRWIGYVDRWTKLGKVYVEQPVEIVEVHVWGLREGVRVAVEGYVDEGKVIKALHTFTNDEQNTLHGTLVKDAGIVDAAIDVFGKWPKGSAASSELYTQQNTSRASNPTREGSDKFNAEPSSEVVFRPKTPIVVPSGDVNLDFERRSKSKYVVTSVAHVWFNVFFEGNGPEQDGKANESGVFEIDFDGMDGIKGTTRKGARAFDRMSVVWRTGSSSHAAAPPTKIELPKANEEVHQTRPADWKKGAVSNAEDDPVPGLHADSDDEELKAVQSHGPFDGTLGSSQTGK